MSRRKDYQPKTESLVDGSVEQEDLPPEAKVTVIQALGEVLTASKGLGRFSRLTRRILYGALILLLPDLILTGFLVKGDRHTAAVARTANAAIHQVQANSAKLVTLQQDQYDRCLSGNQFRQDDLTFWGTLLPQLFAPQPDQTAAQKQQSQAFKKVLVDAVVAKDKFVDCSKLSTTTTQPKKGST